jgi:aromatic ring-opening dioxygenase LigB subunit
LLWLQFTEALRIIALGEEGLFEARFAVILKLREKKRRTVNNSKEAAVVTISADHSQRSKEITLKSMLAYFPRLS